MSIDKSFRGSEKYCGVGCVIDGDICFESASAAGLLDDVGGGIDGEDVNPSQPHAGGFAGVVEPLLANQE